MGWAVPQVNVFHLLCFLECLYYNGVKHPQMANYLSAIKSKFIIFGLDVACFSDHRLKYYQKAVQLHAPLQAKLNKIIDEKLLEEIELHAPLQAKLNKIIDVKLLKEIVAQCDLTYMGQIFKGLYLLSFFSFLRLSNLVPHACTGFSPLKHLARGDIIFKPEKIIVLVKWSKTMQNNNQVKLISVTRIPGSPLCPVRVISNLLSLSPKGSNLPLFQYKLNSSWTPLTDTKVRRHFSLILSRLGLQGTGYTLHTFRCHRCL